MVGCCCGWTRENFENRLKNSAAGEKSRWIGWKRETEENLQAREEARSTNAL